MDSTIIKILKKNRLSLTRSRVELLKVLYRAAAPCSEKEIENMMGVDCNRTTVYRNLSTLAEKGILQRIMSGDSVKYKFHDHLDKRNNKDHIHFECIKCHKVYCMEDLIVKDYKLPGGFQKKENQFLIIGVCKNCSQDE